MEKYLSIRANTALYISVFFVAMHHVFVYLTNSSTLKYVFDLKNSEVLSIYGIASIFGICVYLFLMKNNLIKKPKLGIYLATVLEIVALLFMYYSSTHGNINMFIGLFMIHHLLTPYILFNLDVLFEAYTHIKDRGRSRGIYLTVWNIPFIIVPIIMSTFKVDSLNIVYIISSILLLPFFYLVFTYIKNPENIEDTLITSNMKLWEKLKNFFGDKLDRGSFIIQSTLHLYYGATAVILPIYLHSVFNFDWDKIGLIFAAMTAPFILIQIPFGNIEDKKHNEKAMLHLGYIIAILFTVLLIFIKPDLDPNTSFLLFAIFLFVANAGCSLIEISMESIFYKHVTARDSSALLMFRMARILPYSLGLLAILFL